MNNSEIASLEAYKSVKDQMGERQKAEFEKKLWEDHCASLGAGVNTGLRRTWLISTFGGPLPEYEFRQALINSGSWVDPLWSLIDSGTSRYTVMRIYRGLKSRSRGRNPTLEEAQSAVDSFVRDGYVISSEPVETHHAPVRERPPSKDSEVDHGFSRDSSQSARTRKFLSDIASLTEAYVESSLHDISNSDDVVSTNLLKDEFLGLVREAMEDFRRGMSSLRSNVRRNSESVSKDKFKNACEVLGISVSYGQPVDLRRCKRIMLDRAKTLHPDRNGGSHSRTREYQAVIESYSVLEKYSGGLTNGKTKGDKA